MQSFFSNLSIFANCVRSWLRGSSRYVFFRSNYAVIFLNLSLFANCVRSRLRRSSRYVFFRSIYAVIFFKPFIIRELRSLTASRFLLQNMQSGLIQPFQYSRTAFAHARFKKHSIKMFFNSFSSHAYVGSFSSFKFLK